MDLEEWQIRKQVKIEETKNTMMNNEIFGYWEPGFGPGEENHFTGEKYEWNDEIENWVATPEYDLFLTEHYNKGALDLREWEIQIEGMLGMRGMQPGEEEEPEPEPTKLEDIRAEIKGLQNELSTLQAQASNHPGNYDPFGQYAEFPPSAQDKAAYDSLVKQIKNLKAQINSRKQDEQAWIDQAIADYNPGGS